MAYMESVGSERSLIKDQLLFAGIEKNGFQWIRLLGLIRSRLRTGPLATLTIGADCLRIKRL